MNFTENFCYSKKKVFNVRQEYLRQFIIQEKHHVHGEGTPLYPCPKTRVSKVAQVLWGKSFLKLSAHESIQSWKWNGS